MLWIFGRKKRKMRNHMVTLRKEQMAKLDVIAEAYNLDTNEAINRLIDGFYSAPHSAVGKDVQQTMVTGASAQAAVEMSSNPVVQIFQALPPQAQQALVEKVVGAFVKKSEAGMGF